MMQIRGVCPILPTPFTAAGAVDLESLRQVIRVAAAGGVQGLTLFGIAGEYYKLTEDEERQMLRLMIEECRRAGVASIVSVTKHATDVAVRQARACEEAGADGLMLLPPFFLKPSAAQICAHARAVAHAVRLPVMFQYAPDQTGVALAPEVLARLQDDEPNLCLFKIECRPPGAYMSRLLEVTYGAARLFAGNAGFQLIEALDRGAIGCMPGCSLFDLYLQVMARHAAGDRAGALAVHGALVTFLNHVRQDVEMLIAFEKRILVRRGIIESASSRTPAYEPDAFAMRLFDELYDGLVPFLTSLAGTTRAGR